MENFDEKNIQMVDYILWMYHWRRVKPLLQRLRFVDSILQYL